MGLCMSSLYIVSLVKSQTFLALPFLVFLPIDQLI